MIKEYLLKLQELQREMFGTNITISIQNRKKPSGGEWLCVTVYPEPINGEDLDIHHELFDYYDFQTHDENLMRIEKEYKNIVEFINTHKK